MNDDPVRVVERLAVLIAARGTTGHELWPFVAALTRVIEERPDWIANLPPADRQLFYEAASAPLKAFTDRVQ